MKAAIFDQVRTRTNYRLRMASLMFFADLTALLLAIIIGHILVQGIFHLVLLDGAEIEHVIVLLSCLSLLVSSRLYPGVGINPADEIKMVTQFTFTSMAIGMIFSLLFHSSTAASSIWALTIIWALSFAFVLGLRWTTRIVAVQLGLWKEPVLLIAKGEQARILARRFRQNLRLGFWPSMVATDQAGIEASPTLQDEPVINLKDLALNAHLCAELGIETAVIDLASAGEVLSLQANHALTRSLPRLIFLSDLNWLDGASVHIHDFEGLFGVETRKNELSSFDLVLKNVLDLTLSFLGLVIFFPFLALIALVIKLDSPGSVFYLQDRIGIGNRKFKMIKFRTMVPDGDKILQDYLNANPAKKTGWVQKQKLEFDPRITRSGKWLRKFSIDEIPQLLNVLKGDISLVGARPIMENQRHLYGDKFNVYLHSKPGLTGLWQVSGRNHTTFQERVHYDVYYVHNWSIWLDLYILLRTVWVVLSRDGAY
jgi:Undecaprenyl-phosphate galactose phosphotransferase WbaP